MNLVEFRPIFFCIYSRKRESLLWMKYINYKCSYCQTYSYLFITPVLEITLKYKYSCALNLLPSWSYLHLDKMTLVFNFDILTKYIFSAWSLTFINFFTFPLTYNTMDRQVSYLITRLILKTISKKASFLTKWPWTWT